MASSLCNAKPLILVSVFLFLLLASFFQSSHGLPRFGRRMPLDARARRLFRTNQLPSCEEIVSMSQCSQNLQCSWCKSQDLDDMCFSSKAEARRLPQQVFSCG